MNNVITQSATIRDATWIDSLAGFLKRTAQCSEGDMKSCIKAVSGIAFAINDYLICTACASAPKQFVRKSL